MVSFHCLRYQKQQIQQQVLKSYKQQNRLLNEKYDKTEIKKVIFRILQLNKNDVSISQTYGTQ